MKRNVSLFELNTFKVDATANYFSDVFSVDDLTEVVSYVQSDAPYFILGGGANVLFAEDYNGLIIRNNLKGIEVLSESGDEMVLKVCSGEDWMTVVEYAVERNWSGIENLAFIPGTIGAAVVQNIAAYGQNFEDVFLEAEAINLRTGDAVTFTKDECHFSYRNSIFKGKDHQKFFITSVTIILSRELKANTSYHSRYESLESELGEKKPPYSVSDIYQAVVSLRKKKLPNWYSLGTAGSFFKNPVISKEHFLRLKDKVTELQSYPVEKLDYSLDTEKVEGEYVKVPAGRLLDELGWKGKKIGNVGTFEKQALVVVNLGNATGREILEFSKQMAADVFDNYEIVLEPEVFVLEN